MEIKFDDIAWDDIEGLGQPGSGTMSPRTAFEASATVQSQWTCPLGCGIWLVSVGGVLPDGIVVMPHIEAKPDRRYRAGHRHEITATAHGANSVSANAT